MRRVAYPTMKVFALGMLFAVTGAISLFGQYTPARKETVQLKDVPVKFDKEYGAAIARLGEGTYGEGRLHQMDATLVEIPPGGKLAPHKHLAEEMIYIVSGEGYTNMWKPGTKPKDGKRYDWKTSDVISPSLNVWHEHVNTSKTEPARFLSMTSTPSTVRLFGDPKFVTSSDFVFEDRWQAGLRDPKFLEIKGKRKGQIVTDNSNMAIGHIIRDMMNMKMPVAFGEAAYPEEGINVVPAEGIVVTPTPETAKNVAEAGMAGNRLFEWQNREVIKTDAGGIHDAGDHHHAWEVVYFCPKGEMVTYITRKGQPQRKITWKGGDLIIIEADEIHQHEMVQKGTRFLQFKVSGYFRSTGINGGGMAGTD